jgi:(p)ppGpp synthase/HD superfamily hydrolase
MTSLIELAEDFATEAHAGQLRKYSGKPYIEHPLAVIELLMRYYDVDETVLTAALLHDVVEDTEVTIEEIGQIFGKEVAELVYDLTDHFTPENYPNKNRVERKKLENERLATISDDAKKIKVCDIADNLSSIVAADPRWGVRIMQEMSNSLRAMGFY